MAAPLPKRVGDANGDVNRLNDFATNTSIDTYNYLRDLDLRAKALQAEITVLQGDVTTINAEITALQAEDISLQTQIDNRVRVDINTAYSAKSPLTGADQVYVADSAASNAIKRATLTDVVALAAQSSPYIDAPASPNAFDDEFTSGSNDLATRGYTIKTSGGTTLTRGGDIQSWNATGPVGNTYWSRLSRSFLLLQIPVSTTVFIFKSITLSAGDSYFARVGSNYRYDSGGSANFQEVGLYGDTGGRPDTNNRAYVSHYETATNMNCDMAVSKAGAVVGTSRAIYSAHDIRGVRYKSGTDYFPCSVDSANGQSLNNNPAAGSSPAAATLVYFALQFTTPAGGSTPNIHTIDFIRKKTGDVWIAE